MISFHGPNFKNLALSNREKKAPRAILTPDDK